MPLRLPNVPSSVRWAIAGALAALVVLAGLERSGSLVSLDPSVLTGSLWLTLRAQLLQRSLHGTAASSFDNRDYATSVTDAGAGTGHAG